VNPKERFLTTEELRKSLYKKEKVKAKNNLSLNQKAVA
jgi:hypothetical protein